MARSRENYIVEFDRGVKLHMSIEKRRNGPTVQPPLIESEDTLVRLPGDVVAVYAPRRMVNGIAWELIAEAFGAKLVMPVPVAEFRDPKRVGDDVAYQSELLYPQEEPESR